MPDIHHQIQIAAPAKTIFPLISSAEGFQRWWAEDARHAEGSSGMIDLGFFSRATAYRLRPQTFMAPKQTSWHCESGEEWAGTSISFVVGPGPEGSLLRFTHSGWHAETDYFTACNTTWGALLYRLRAAAEGHDPGPLFTKHGLSW